MSQVSMTVRIDSDIKSSFEKLCTQFGMSANAAMNVFARAVVQRGKIPFELMSDEAARKAVEAQEAMQAQQMIDKMWAEKGLDVDAILNEHLRTPYRPISQK